MAQCSSRSIIHMRESWKVLAFAQLLSLLLAISGATNSTLSYECQLSAPTALVGLIYFSMAFHLFWIPTYAHPNECDFEHVEEEAEGSSMNVDMDRVRGVIADASDDHGTNPHTNEYSSEHPPRHLLFHHIPIHGSYRTYLLMAFLDVEANYLTYLAFRYTSLTSISLLDALAIPSAMVCSRFILKRIYRTPHFVGAAVCIVGVVVNVLGDYHGAASASYGMDCDIDDGGCDSVNANDDGGMNPEEAFPHALRGDLLATVGAILYGLNDVLAERMVKNINVKEYLGILGLFGSMICFLQAILTERDLIAKFVNTNDDAEGRTCTTGKVWLLVGSNTLFGVLSYSGMSNFLLYSEAALLNLSLLFCGRLCLVLSRSISYHPIIFGYLCF